MRQLNVADFVDSVGFADPSSGKLSKGGAMNAIVIVGQLDDGRAFALDEWIERTDSTMLTARIFEKNRLWRCKRFGVESSGQQNLYFQGIVREADLRRERIALVPVEQPTTENKEFRITVTIQRFMHNGLLFVSDNCKTLLRQLERYPTGQLCDGVDALASALRMLRDPLASRKKLEYDEAWDEERRFTKAAKAARLSSVRVLT